MMVQTPPTRGLTFSLDMGESLMIINCSDQRGKILHKHVKVSLEWLKLVNTITRYR